MNDEIVDRRKLREGGDRGGVEQAAGSDGRD
jgi:hypothetical protein